MKALEKVSMIRSLSIALLVLTILTVNLANAELGVGVKHGDWMEYGVSYEGLPELAANFFGYEIIDVNNNVLTIKGTTNYSNGTIETENYVVDIFKNSFKDFDGFIIPSPIGEDLSFFSGDINRGDLNISSFETKEYSGANRDVAITNFSRDDSSSIYIYDRSHGILVEYQRFESDYSLSVKLENTNLWSSKIFGIEPNYFYVLTSLIVLIIGVALFLTLRKRLRA